jgi:hypothetical protein
MLSGAEDKLKEDIDFVFSECMRFSRMPRSELRNLGREHMFCVLPHPSGTGSMICGRDAQNRLIDISNEVIRLNRLDGRVTASSVRHHLGEALVRRFMNERREINEQQIDKLVSSLGRAALRGCTAKTHFVPCHLLQVEDPAELRLGPVTFRTRTNFRNRILQKVYEYSPTKNLEFGRKRLADALHYYRGFKWVAEVTVPTADSESSKRLALATVQAAVNCLTVIFGANSTGDMVVGGTRAYDARMGHLWLSPEDAINAEISVSYGGPGQMEFPRGWWERLPVGARPALNLCGIVLESAANPTLDRPVSRRVLDAIQWFGEGVRETTGGAKVVKYVTALERMLMTREHDNIADVVANRAAAFCSVSDLKLPLEKWKADALRLYDLRSRLVHGDMSPQCKDVAVGVRLGERIVRLAILGVLNHIEEAGLKAGTISNARLSRWFDEIVRLSREPNPSLQCVDEGSLYPEAGSSQG